MKKKTGIWIAAASAAISLYGLLLVGLTPEVPEQLGYQSGTEAAEQTEHIDSAESMAVQKPYRFVIKILEGKLAVYGSDGTTVFFETGIDAANLEESLLNRIEEGLFFEAETDLYEFLENCSS